MTHWKIALLLSVVLLVGLATLSRAGDDEPRPILNGADLASWQAVGGSLAAWHLEDGVLYPEGEKGGWLSTQDEYANFELDLEFRLPEGGNSGVFLRAPREGNPWQAGMEIQVLDDHAEKHSQLKPYQYCGSLYGVAAAEPRSGKKAGEWQKMHIRCDGPHVQVVLNDALVVDADLTEHQDLLQEHPGLERTSGYIGLQNYGDRVEFRNVFLRELP